MSFRGNEVTVGISRKRNVSYGDRRAGRGRPPLQDFTDCRGCHAITLLLPFFRPLMRCGVRDTVASVPTTFWFFFFA